MKVRQQYSWSWRYWLALTLAVSGLGLLLLYSFHPAFNDLSFDLNPQLSSDFGTFVGGFLGSLFSLAGVLLLFETLTRQQDIFRRQQFETRFFEILRIHRENVHEMVHKLPQEKGEVAQGRRVFLEMRRQFGKILEETRSSFNGSLVEKEQIDVSYLILFFGVGLDSLDMLKHKLAVRYPDKALLLDDFVETLREKKAADGRNVYFGGHQARLGHYFRHLYQSVKYVHTQTFLTDEEKYDYVKTLRAQLSTSELVIFFFNSLSQLGEKWEVVATDSEKKLITNYRFIKNIPKGFTFGIDPKNTTHSSMSMKSDDVRFLPNC